MVPEAGVILAFTPFTVLVKPPLCVHVAVWLLMMLTPVPATPFTDVLRVFALDVLLTADTVAEVAATPFTVDVRVLPDSDMVFELMIGTAVPDTPFTVVLRVFEVDVLLTPDTDEEVAATPFTVDVRVLPNKDRVLELMMGAVALATPFTDVLSVLALDVVLTAETAADVAVTPFTEDVSVLPDSDSVFELMIGTVAPTTPFTVVESAFVLEVLLTVVAVVMEVGSAQVALPAASLCSR